MGRIATLALLGLVVGCPSPEPDPPGTIPPSAPGPAVPVTPPADRMPPTVDSPPPASPDAPFMTITIYFTRDEAQVPVTRRVERSPAVLRTALEELLKGPTPEERLAGLGSWFSAETADKLQRVVFDAETGRATVDFHDFRRIIPGASTSAGSAMLLGELNGTVFEFEQVQEVLYRFEGDCDAFWEWLQRECEVVRRQGG